MAAISINPTVYGATQTTTFFATTIATVGQVVYFDYPSPPTSPAIHYTTPPAPTNQALKQFPTGLPILVLTQLNGVVVNPSGAILTTATIIQAPPPMYPTLPSGQKIDLIPESSAWASWTSSERNGVIAAIVLTILGFIAVLFFLLKVRKKRKRMEEEIVSGPRSGGGQKGSSLLKRLITGFTKGYAGRKTVKPDRGKKERNGPRGIEGLADVEMGPAARMVVYGNQSSRPPPKDREQSMSNKRNERPRKGSGRYEMSGALQARDQEQIPVGLRPLLPPNQQRTP